VVKNVTVTLEEDVAHWARIEAARRGTSVSRLLGELLRARMERESVHEQAQAQFLAVEPRHLKKRGAYPERDQLHDREGLR